MIYGSVSTGSHCEQLVFEDELGWECAFVSEIDKYANQAIRYHAPDTPNLGDFTEIEANESTTRIELLCGGTPCQDFSVAGLRAGLAGERGGLSVEFLKLVARLEPTWFVWENVPGVLSSWHAETGPDEHGRWVERNAFDQFLAGIRHIGYYAAWRVLDAQYFGVPQRRRRVFVVGHISDWRRATAVLFEPESMQGHPAPSREAGSGIAGTLEARASTGGYDPGAHGAASGHLQVAAPVTTSPHADHESQESKLTPVSVTGDRTHSLRAEGADASEDGTGRGTPIVAQCHGSNVGGMGALRAGNGNETGGVPFVAFNGRQDPCPSDQSAGALDEDGLSQCIAFSSKDHGADAGETAPTLRSMNNRESNVNGGGQVAVAFQAKQSASAEGPSFDGVSPSLDVAKAGGMSALQGMRVRRLMPIECERLQGWPDSWTEYGIDENGEQVEISDTQRYKIIGNGWALPVVRWVAHRIDRINAQTRGITN